MHLATCSCADCCRLHKTGSPATAGTSLQNSFSVGGTWLNGKNQQCTQDCVSMLTLRDYLPDMQRVSRGSETMPTWPSCPLVKLVWGCLFRIQSCDALWKQKEVRPRPAKHWVIQAQKLLRLHAGLPSSQVKIALALALLEEECLYCQYEDGIY